MRKLIESLGDLRYLATAFAVFSSVFGVLTTSDLNTFYSGYSAGAGGAIALLLWLEDD